MHSGSVSSHQIRQSQESESVQNLKFLLQLVCWWFPHVLVTSATLSELQLPDFPPKNIFIHVWIPFPSSDCSESNPKPSFCLHCGGGGKTFSCQWANMRVFLLSSLPLMLFKCTISSCSFSVCFIVSFITDMRTDFIRVCVLPLSALSLLLCSPLYWTFTSKYLF